MIFSIKMKDLTDYFTSPGNKTKGESKTNEEITNDPPLVVVVDLVGNTSKERFKEDSKVLTNIENSTKDAPKKKTKKDKRHKRKSDPAVKNITDLLSNSLSIISPNSSFTKTATQKNVESASEKKIKDSTLKKKRSPRKDTSGDILYEDNKSTKIQNEKETENSSFQKEKNLNNICLQNDKCVQGKCLENKMEANEMNQRLSMGKLNAFQFMMESRNKSIGQNSPGKDFPENDRPEDDKDSKEKLSARKILMQNWADKKGASKRKRNEEEKDEIINHKLKKRARRLKKLLHVDEEDSNDVILKGKRKRIKRISSGSDSSIESVAVIENAKEILTNSVSDTLEENAQDHVLNGSKLKETKKSLLNFFEVVNKARKDEDNNKTDDNNRETRNRKREKRKSRLSLKKIENEHKDAKDCIVIEENTSEQPIIVGKSKTPKPKKNRNELENPKTPKNKISDEGEESLTPRSLKSWKMKIKLSTDDEELTDKNAMKRNVDNNKVLRPKRNTSVINKALNLDERTDEGKSKTDEQNKVLQVEEIILSSEDENCSKENKTHRKSNKLVKIAPVFVKATPKPKPAPELLEAKKQFLMSGIPNSLKKAREKQQSIEEKDYEVFPSTSHVQQKCEKHSFWHLPKPQLNLKEYSPLKTIIYESCIGLTNSHIASKLNMQMEVEKVDNLKTLLNKIKGDNPNYPVYKSFRLIYEKSGKMSEKREEKTATPKRQKSKKRRKKNPNRSVEIIEPEKQEVDSVEYAMWTDKYKPKCSDDIIGNSHGVKSLKKWLETWINFSQERNSKKRRRSNSSSGSEFETTDCDSRDSTKFPGNTVVLGGPCGSGKSVSIYAICIELGFNVIELNCSSKRTGKRLLQELQEATQSHQVRKGDQNNFFRASKPKETSESQTDRRMCVLLIEDVDIVFEQDDGFISALTQLVNTSKRPIIMTTTDSTSIYVQRFVNQYEYISFMPLSSQCLATWLQIVCLVEGLFVNQGDIGSLLEYNKGDVRRTLLQLQYWVQSGGQINRDKVPVKLVHKKTITEKMPDDEQLLSCIEDSIGGDKKKTVFSHSNCIISFEVFRDYKQYRIPYYFNLGLIWWNIPNILNLPNFSQKRRSKFNEDKNDEQPLEVDMCKEKIKLCPAEKKKLDMLANLYDCLAFTDVSFRKINHSDGIEPIVKNCSVDIKDSLELGECMDCFNGNLDFVHEVTHTLVNGHIEQYNAIGKDESNLNMSVPERAERRWRAKHQACRDVFEEALTLSSYVDRKSVALDYMPSLRNIARSERLRAATNTKRGNRFRNYLRDLNIRYNDKTVKLACNILAVDEF